MLFFNSPWKDLILPRGLNREQKPMYFVVTVLKSPRRCHALCITMFRQAAIDNGPSGLRWRPIQQCAVLYHTDDWLIDWLQPRSQGLFPVRPKAREKTLGTRLDWLFIIYWLIIHYLWIDLIDYLSTSLKKWLQIPCIINRYFYPLKET